MAKRLYSLKAVEKFLCELYERDFDVVQISEGSLLAGDYIVPPTTLYPKYIIIREIALNCWSSAYTVERHSKLTKEEQELFDNACIEM